MIFYRPLTEDEFIGDLAVRFALRDQRRHLTLACGQPATPPARGEGGKVWGVAGKPGFCPPVNGGGGAARRDGLFSRQPFHCRACKAFAQGCIVNRRCKCLDGFPRCRQFALGVILTFDMLV